MFKWHNFHCCLCGGTDYTLLTTLNDEVEKSIVECNNCGLKQWLTTPSLMERRHVLSNNYQNINPENWFVNEETRSYATMELIKNYIVLDKSKNVLDVGCGTGALLANLKTEFSCNVEGIEAEKHLAEYGINVNKAKIQITTFETAKFKKKYDLVIMLGVLYYFKNDEVMIKKIINLLKTNAMLFIKLNDFRARTVKNLTEYRDISAFFDKEHVNQLFDRYLEYVDSKYIDYGFLTKIIQKSNILFKKRFPAPFNNIIKPFLHYCRFKEIEKPAQNSSFINVFRKSV